MVSEMWGLMYRVSHATRERDLRGVRSRRLDVTQSCPGVVVVLVEHLLTDRQAETGRKCESHWEGWLGDGVRRQGEWFVDRGCR